MRATNYVPARTMRKARLAKYTTDKAAWEALHPGQAYPVAAPATVSAVPRASKPGGK
jgi:hypothetical protein